MSNKYILLFITGFVVLTIALLAGMVYLSQNRSSSEMPTTSDITQISPPTNTELQATPDLEEQILNHQGNRGVIVFENGKFTTSELSVDSNGDFPVLITALNKDPNPETFTIIEEPLEGIDTEIFTLDFESMEALGFNKPGYYRVAGANSKQIITIEIL